MGHYTLKGRGQHGTVPKKHAVQQSGLWIGRLTSKVTMCFTFPWWSSDLHLESSLSHSILKVPLYFSQSSLLQNHSSKKKKKNKKTTCREQIQLQPAHPRASWSFLKQKTQADTEVVALLGRPQFCCPKSTLTPLDFSQGFIRNHSFSWYFFFPLSFLFLVLISSNKNNEFHKPTRMWQGVNKANQEGDVWPLQCP